MSIVNSIETVRDWLTTEVCPLVKLKPGETITDETLDELTGGKGDDNE